MHTIKTIAELETVYNIKPVLASTAKEIDHIAPAYQNMIELSPLLRWPPLGLKV